jgi:hypothetical protein
MTQPKYGDAPLDEPPQTNAAIATQLQQQPLIRNSAVRLAYQPGMLFVDGEALPSSLPDEGLCWLCEQKQITADDLGSKAAAEQMNVLAALVNHDAYYFDAD